MGFTAWHYAAIRLKVARRLHRIAFHMKTLPALLTTILLTGLTLRAEEHKLTADNTTIKFVGSKKDGKHEGTFKKLNGTLTVDKADVAKSKVSVTIDVDSIKADAALLTKHLKSPDFFDAKRFPQATFVSKSIKPAKEKDSYTVTGDLTMVGKTHAVTFPAKAVTAGGTTTVSAQFDIKRSDWGMNYGMDKVNDAVNLTLEVKLATK
jgi:polyisoprenoid-binding protein YceI